MNLMEEITSIRTHIQKLSDNISKRELKKEQLEKELEQKLAQAKKADFNEDRGVLPPGFAFFWFNKLEESCWILTLVGRDGSVVWEARYRKDLSEDIARHYAITDAWTLVDATEAIIFQRNKRIEDDLRKKNKECPF